MGIILRVIFGGLVGWIASSIMNTNEGIILNIILGIIGAIIGGWLMSFFGKIGVTGFNFYSFIVAIIGAVALIAVVKMLRRV